MRLLIQRVKRASVTIDGGVRSRIGAGLLALVGVGNDDGAEDVEYLAGKLVRLRSRIGIPDRMSETMAIQEVAIAAREDRCTETNPRPVSTENLIALLREVQP